MGYWLLSLRSSRERKRDGKSEVGSVVNYWPARQNNLAVTNNNPKPKTEMVPPPPTAYAHRKLSP